MDIKELREIVKALPTLPPTADRFTWLRRRIEVKRHILTQDPSEFLQWSTIHETMFVGSAPYTDYEFERLMSSGEKWQDAIIEPRFGNPPMYNEITSGNVIHQAYMLKLFEDLFENSINDFDSIIEFGGGYGAMARMVRRLGFSGRYTIYDFPEFSALQAYYLSNVGVSDVTTISDISDVIHHELVVALWSMSEAPIEDRDKFLSLSTPSAMYAAYVPHWDGMNNWSWFGDLGLRYRNVLDIDLHHMKKTSSRIFIAHGTAI